MAPQILVLTRFIVLIFYISIKIAFQNLVDKHLSKEPSPIAIEVHVVVKQLGPLRGKTKISTQFTTAYNTRRAFTFGDSLFSRGPQSMPQLTNIPTRKRICAPLETRQQEIDHTDYGEKQNKF
ncbi:hypothetical protein [Barnesiella sp. An55]|uniref:hypothetical protein n=1 Tax=Barnesiella sp. An55 TaxID=1965646 RepID=UPI001302D979|nr:hypothetical protein [Barnesiella sp. An55]